MNKENFKLEELLQALRNSEIAEINEDVNKIMSMLNDKKTYSFVVMFIQQECPASHGSEYYLATLMSNEEVERRGIKKFYRPRNEQGFLNDSRCATKSWECEDDESEDMIFLQDETFELLFNISL